MQTCVIISMLDPWGIGEVGIALDWQSRGQGFESPILHQIKNTAFMVVFLIFEKCVGIRTRGLRGYREMESSD